MTDANGVLRVLRDVTLHRGIDGEFVTVCGHPVAVGERLQLERVVDGILISTTVQVTDSRPVMLNGSVRYRLILTPIDGAATDTVA